MDIDSWVAAQPVTRANAAALTASPAYSRPFRPMAMPQGAEALPAASLIPMAGMHGGRAQWGRRYAGLGREPTKAEIAAKTPATVNVEAAAAAQEAQGFTYLAAGAAGGVAGAALKQLPVAARVALAIGGTVVTILGVKHLAEAEATRQAGAKVGLILAQCMAKTIIGKSKIPL